MVSTSPRVTRFLVRVSADACGVLVEVLAERCQELRRYELLGPSLRSG